MYHIYHPSVDELLDFQLAVAIRNTIMNTFPHISLSTEAKFFYDNVFRSELPGWAVCAVLIMVGIVSIHLPP
jgi:hypothetical protein